MWRVRSRVCWNRKDKAEFKKPICSALLYTCSPQGRSYTALLNVYQWNILFNFSAFPLSRTYPTECTRISAISASRAGYKVHTYILYINSSRLSARQAGVDPIPVQFSIFGMENQPRDPTLTSFLFLNTHGYLIQRNHDQAAIGIS